MKRTRLACSLLPLAGLFGCSSLNNTENGTLAGGAIGAGTGAIIGNATGHTAGGALIGGAVGALSGGLIGHAADQQEKRAEERAAQARAMALNDVVSLTQQHVSDTVIINQIRSSASIFYLSGAEITWLKQNGVSDRVIMEMQATAARYPRRVYTAAPVYGEPVYVVEPPPPPVSVGFGFGYTRVR
jgi:hypothetical protein